MILGMSLPAFTAFHVFLSLTGLLAGVLFVAGLIRTRDNKYVTQAFLVLTTATSLTGFLFPATQVLPSHITGIISLAVLAVAGVAFSIFKLRGSWRWIYVAATVAAFYLNAFVAVVQAFLKVPGLHDLAPTGAEPPFLAAQTAVLIAFIAVGVLAARRFRPAAASAA